MKTAVSIPDPVFHAADEMARRLGVSRSEFYATAAAEYMERHRHENITESLNRIYDEEDSSLDASLHSMQVISIGEEDW